MSRALSSHAPVILQVPGYEKGLEFRPIGMDDLNAACEFFTAMPEQDRNYLPFDVTDRETIERRIRAIEEWRNLRRLVALDEGRIVATGTILLHDPGWMRHVAEMRLIVGGEHRKRGIGKRLAAELFKIAATEQVEEIVVQMMLPQDAAYGIFKRLGFRDEVVMEKHVKDLHGNPQDLRIMCCGLKTLWKEMEGYVEDLDTRRHR